MTDEISQEEAALINSTVQGSANMFNSPKIELTAYELYELLDSLRCLVKTFGEDEVARRLYNKIASQLHGSPIELCEE